MGGVFNPYDDTNLLVLIAVIDALCNAILEDTVAIREVTDSEAILTETSGQITTDGTEQNVYISEAPAGIFRPICVKIKVTNHTVTETIVIKEYYRMAPGGGWVRFDTVPYAGAIAEEGIKVDLDPTRYGVRVTIQKTAGTNRAYDWEAFYKEAP